MPTRPHEALWRGASQMQQFKPRQRPTWNSDSPRTFWLASACAQANTKAEHTDIVCHCCAYRYLLVCRSQVGAHCTNQSTTNMKQTKQPHFAGWPCSPSSLPPGPARKFIEALPTKHANKQQTQQRMHTTAILLDPASRTKRQSNNGPGLLNYATNCDM